MTELDWWNLKQDIQAQIINQGYGPLIVRLAWHDAGTWNGVSGGPHAQMLHTQVAEDEGLHFGQEFLQPIKDKYPGISNADLWSFAGTVVIANSGGPALAWRPNRADAVDAQDDGIQNGMLPDAHWDASGLRKLFYAKGFNDQEIVALSGGHCLGEIHTGVSGSWSGKWTQSPSRFNNEFFVRLVNGKYAARPDGLFEDTSDSSFKMLPSDIALLKDPVFRGFAESYASDQSAFFNDFASAWEKLMELGVGGSLGSIVDTNAFAARPEPSQPVVVTSSVAPVSSSASISTDAATTKTSDTVSTSSTSGVTVTSSSTVTVSKAAATTTNGSASVASNGAVTDPAKKTTTSGAMGHNAAAAAALYGLFFLLSFR
ncbi:heme peroxidase [Chytriomyces hyalinus]|nr:heme peroxidase [Chytriomyces hyalinus]